MKCLVTGAAGFIGSNLCRELIRRGHSVIAFDKLLHAEQWNNIKDLAIPFFYGDISKADDLAQISRYEYDVIFNLAAISDTLEDSIKNVMSSNVKGFRNIIQLARQCAPKGGIVHASSAATYGQDIKIPFKETQEQIPVNLYAWSKKQNDIDIMGTVDYPIIGLKYFNVYGPGENYKKHMKSVIGQKIDEALANKPIRLFGAGGLALEDESNGSEQRDWIYIDDAVNMTIMAAKAVLKKVAGVFNCGTGRARTFNEVFESIQYNVENELEIQWINNVYRERYQDYTQADMTNFYEHIGEYEPLPIEEGIKRYIDAEK